MKKQTVYILFSLIVFSACKKQDTMEKQILGEWFIEAVKQEKGSMSIGFDDISGEVSYQKLLFEEDHSVMLITKNDTHSGSWDIIHEQQPNYHTQGSNQFNYRTKLNLRWKREFEYLDNTYINVLRKNKLKFFSNREHKDVEFVCVK